MSMENGHSDQDNAEWKAPEETAPEAQEVNMEVVAFDPPEVPEGGREYRPDTEDVKRHIIEDENGTKLYHHETSEGKSDWQTKFAYGKDGKIISKEHQQLIKDRQSHTLDTFEYDEDSGEYLKKIGEIKAGPDAGHKYEELPIVEKDLGDEKIIKTITTKILEQGQNGSGKRAANSTVFTKKVYMLAGKWLGDHVTGTDGSESMQFPKNGKQELPNWE
ncbi:MAG: hypothetical protein Q8P20_08465 [bacterium]|nr:hypothetical protein [bacterium]